MSKFECIKSTFYYFFYTQCHALRTAHKPKMNPLIFTEFHSFLRIDCVYTNALLSSVQTKHSPHFNCGFRKKLLMKYASKNNITFRTAWFVGFTLLQFWHEVINQQNQKRLIQKFQKSDFHAFRLGCKTGNISTLRFFVQHIDQVCLKAAFYSCDFYSFRCATETQQVATLKFLASHFDQVHLVEAFRANDFFAFQMAAQHDHIDTFKFFTHQFNHSLLDQAFDSDDFLAIIFAFEYGNYNVVDFFTQQFDQARLKRSLKMIYLGRYP